MKKLIQHLLIALGAMLGLFSMPAVAIADALPEYTLKAGYLYNFALLTEWPVQDSDGSFEMCFYGQESFDGVLDAVRGKLVSNQPIQIVKITKPAEASRCELLFVSGVSRGQFRQLTTELGRRPVLIVTDDHDLAQAGAMVMLRPDNHRLTFDINLGAAKQVNLNISARLLRLAKEVVTE